MSRAESDLANFHASDTERIIAWLIEAGLSGEPVEDILGGFCERLDMAGLRMARAYLGLSTLHPLLRANGYIWQRGTGILATGFAHAEETTQAWQRSPFAYMLDTGSFRLRRRLVGAEAVLDFPVLSEFRDLGLTDWYAAAFSYGMDNLNSVERQLGLVTSFATDRPGGFTEANLAVLEQLLRILALTLKGASTYRMARTLLGTYLGSDPADRVMSGDIQRGSVQGIGAVLYYADLRGFTQLADSVPTAELVELLDQYLDCMGNPVERRGGQVLKFIGDGLLATFELAGEGRSATCDLALDAAAEALAKVASLNRERARAGLAVMELDVVLHLGDVLYGNVGTAERLDFTVVGPAVNEASRMELLCKRIGRNLLTSGSFADAEGGRRLISVGRHQLPDVRGSTELFTLAVVPEAA